MEKSEISQKINQVLFVKNTVSWYQGNNLSNSSLIFVLILAEMGVHAWFLTSQQSDCILQNNAVFQKSKSSRFQKSSNYVLLRDQALLLYGRTAVLLVSSSLPPSFSARICSLEVMHWFWSSDLIMPFGACSVLVFMGVVGNDGVAK